jgi:hypothetical protein
MIKLYRYYLNQIEETYAERETAKFWIINGRREAKLLQYYPERRWFRSPEEAVITVINRKTAKRDSLLLRAQQYQEDIDEATKFLLLLGTKEDKP